MTKRRADFKSGLNLVIGREHANGHGQIEAQPLLLDIRRRQSDRRIPPPRIDLHLDGESFDSIDRSRQYTGQHGWIVGERGRKGNAVLSETLRWRRTAVVFPHAANKFNTG